VDLVVGKRAQGSGRGKAVIRYRKPFKTYNAKKGRQSAVQTQDIWSAIYNEAHVGEYQGDRYQRRFGAAGNRSGGSMRTELVAPGGGLC